VVTKIDDAAPADRTESEDENATAPPAIAMPTKYKPKRFIAAS
jgi:hypothetical protein